MSRKKIELTQAQEKLFNELKRLTKRANQRILRLEREHAELEKEILSIRQLANKLSSVNLGAWSSSGRIRASKSMSEEQMRAVIKATKGFLANPYSTKSGAKRAKKRAVQTLYERFGIDSEDFTYEEAETLEKFFEDTEVNKVTNYLEGSDVLAIVQDMRERENATFDDFVTEMYRYQRWNKGKNIKQLRNIWTKYIKNIKGTREEKTMQIFDYLANWISEAPQEELDEIEGYINDLYTENLINKKEYDYYYGLVENKRL